MNDIRLLLTLLHATLRRAVAKISTNNTQTSCLEAHLANSSFGGNIVIELRVNAFIPLTWPSFVPSWQKRGPHILHVGHPPFWRRSMGLFKKCSLIFHVQYTAGIITSHVCIQQGNGAPIDLAESTYI